MKATVSSRKFALQWDSANYFQETGGKRKIIQPKLHCVTCAYTSVLYKDIRSVIQKKSELLEIRKTSKNVYLICFTYVEDVDMHIHKLFKGVFYKVE